MDEIDVLISSTCRMTIEKTIPSFLSNVSSRRKFNFIVNIDVKNTRHLPRIENYLRNLGIRDVRVNMNPLESPGGHAEAVNYLFRRIKSPIFFNLEDDWVFLRRIDLDELIDIMDKSDGIDHIRFNKSKTDDYCWLYHRYDEDLPQFRKPVHNTNILGVDLVKTYVWSFNPSLARKNVIQNLLPLPIDKNPEQFVCHGYDEIYKSKGTYLYGHIGEEPYVRDIGRNRLIWKLKDLKWQLKNRKKLSRQGG